MVRESCHVIEDAADYVVTLCFADVDLKGLNEDLKTDPPCHPRACAIQDCLTRNGFKEERCKPMIIALYECCEAFYRSKGNGATTASCPKPDLLQLKLKRLREESQQQ